MVISMIPAPRIKFAKFEENREKRGKIEVVYGGETGDNRVAGFYKILDAAKCLSFSFASPDQ